MKKLLSLTLGVVLVFAGCSNDDSKSSGSTSNKKPTIEMAELMHTSWLRERLPDSALGYVRLPTPWFSVTALQNGFEYAQGNKIHVEQIQKIQQGFSQNLISQMDKSTGPIVDLLVSHMNAPLEIGVIPGEQPPMFPMIIVATKLDFADLNSFQETFEKLLQQESMIQITQPQNAEGQGAFMVQGVNVIYQFQPVTQQMTLLLGMGLTDQILKDKLAGLTDNPKHPMFALESKIDSSGHGLFGYFNAQTIIPAIKSFLPPEQLMGLQMAGVDKMNAIAFGYGASNNKTRLKFLVDMPDVGFRAFLPNINNKFDLNAVGQINSVGVLSLPTTEQFKKIESAILMIPGNATDYNSFKQTVSTTTGYTLEQLMAVVGPEMIYFSDEVSDFIALRLNDKVQFEKMLNDFKAKGWLDFKTLDKNGSKIGYVSTQAFAGLGEMSAALKVDSPIASSILANMKSRYYWMEENGYIIYSAIPQPLIERSQRSANSNIEKWLSDVQQQDLSSAFLGFSTSREGMSRTSYHVYLQLVQALADIGGAEIDMMALPHAGEIGLADRGTLGFNIDMNTNYLALELSFEESFLDLFYAGGMESVAMIGILAAVALPAYQDYTVKAQVSEAVASVASLKMDIAGLLLSGMPLQSINNGVSDIGEATDYASRYLYFVEVSKGQIMLSLGGEDGDQSISGYTLILTPELEQNSGDVTWDCTQGDLPEKYRPKDCH